MVPKLAESPFGRAKIIAATNIAFSTMKLKSTFVIVVIPQNLQMESMGNLLLVFAPLSGSLRNSTRNSPDLSHVA
jgi:hypothetical protein